ncbi:MAG: hypothetical protein M1814_001199 [Vezdaea aestivalis]|nr:MAG: hypothetical protein M1814_001199 [Vezdaea aestivalis]
MATNSPVSTKKIMKAEVPKENSQPSKQVPQSSNTISRSSSNSKSQSNRKSSTHLAAPSTETSQPLAPPPRPNQQSAESAEGYNNSRRSSDSHFSLEPNPFEQSFGGPSSSDAAGKSLLPPVASLTSPAPLAAGGAPNGAFWPNSLRAGPLSPAMLAGPAGSTDYFDHPLRGGFPTPNESSLRTGLTPGGGGSMFPAPSPSSQAFIQQLAGGTATPNTLDFHRIAMNATAAQKSDDPQSNTNGIQNTRPEVPSKMNSSVDNAPAQPDPFGHDANDAANGLYLLAQARNGAQPQSQYVAVNQQPGIAAPPTASAKRPSRNMSGSMGSASESGRGMSLESQEFSESGTSEQNKPNTRNRGKKAPSAAKTTQNSAGNRRKAEETLSKAPAPKKTKISREFEEPPDSDEEDDKMDDEVGENGKALTDEEKRKNFLERNRIAALKCRQRKKQWLANLQTKVEIFSGENDALNAQVTQLREEIVSLKTLLLAHKDCPVSQAQGLGGMAMSAITGDYSHHNNPYGMGMPNGAQVMAGPPMQRR